MRLNIKQRLEGVPWALVILVYIMLFLGLFNLFSASGAHMSGDRFWDQVKWIVIGSFALIFWGLMLDIRTIYRFVPVGYVLVSLLLFLVDVSGQITKGSQRWLELGPFRVQPSEFAKFIMILALARSYSIARHGEDTYNLWTLWKQYFVVGFPVLLILLQPDLGTAGLVILISAFQIFLARLSWRSIVSASIAGISFGVIAWNFFLYDYQKLRVLNFLNPMRDPQGSGYHSIQSMIAVGSGGFLGRGFQQGTQSQLNYLPERHTDFIFSVIAEEHGFLGCLVVFSLFAVLLILIFQVAEKAKDTFSALIAIGVAGFIIFHFLINVAMVLGLFPVVGVPLSFFSYGGTHMLTLMSCMGLLIAIERRRHVQSI